MQTIITEIKRHLPQDEEARRLFHGRGRIFPGYQDLLIDSYGSLLWITLFAARAPAWRAQLAAELRKLRPQTTCIALQRRDLPHEPPEVLYGALPSQAVAHEAGLNYQLRLTAGQNIGFFIDMAVGRKLVRKNSAGKKILNLFSYTCSFSVAALAGGARQVVNIDMNRGALQLGRTNHQLNNLDLRRVSFLPHEIFRSLSRLRKLGPFDLIICDPPFAQGKNFTAETHWPKLIARLGPLLAPAGEVIACLNAPQMSATDLRSIFAENLPHLDEDCYLTAGADFPGADPDRGLTIQHYKQLSKVSYQRTW